MSAQFGRWNFEGEPPERDYIENVAAILARYGPDSCDSYSKDGTRILYGAFCTTKESRRETQPSISLSGAVVTWDGRLDNRTELISTLRNSLIVNSTDVAIVAAAFEKWGTNCFAKLIGDWALSIWNPVDRSLILAKDPLGTRHLYYLVENDHVLWSTILDAILFAHNSFVIHEEYIAGWFSSYPAAHLTPYVGIASVPPSSFVLIRTGQQTVRRYWDFDPGKRIRYRLDCEYEEHFRAVFATAVRRRLRSDRPVLAELSGGIDSSSIVCMGDIVVARGEAETPRLDTISYYDDFDPALDERVYVSKVEQKRGRIGYHIDLTGRGRTKEKEDHSTKLFLCFESACDRLSVTPDSNRNLWPELFEPYASYLRSHDYRVTLSGIAGEDATGGFVPTPVPELQDLLARARLLRLVHQLREWARKIGKPSLRLLWEALKGFSSCSLTYPWAPKVFCPPPWFQPSFVERNKAALSWYPSELKPFGALPSFQNQVHLLNHTRRFLAHRNLSPDLLREIRYPFLDRDLLEFAFAIPREQMVGVGKRRFLMKRALTGIVPHELLNRKRRATGRQMTNRDISAEWPTVVEIGDTLVSSSLGIVVPNLFLQALQKARRNEEVPFESLARTVFLESWLRHLAIRGVLA